MGLGLRNIPDRFHSTPVGVLTFPQGGPTYDASGRIVSSPPSPSAATNAQSTATTSPATPLPVGPLTSLDRGVISPATSDGSSDGGSSSRDDGLMGCVTSGDEVFGGVSEGLERALNGGVIGRGDEDEDIRSALAMSDGQLVKGVYHTADPRWWDDLDFDSITNDLIFARPISGLSASGMGLPSISAMEEGSMSGHGVDSVGPSEGAGNAAADAAVDTINAFESIKIVDDASKTADAIKPDGPVGAKKRSTSSPTAKNITQLASPQCTTTATTNSPVQQKKKKTIITFQLMPLEIRNHIWRAMIPSARRIFHITYSRSCPFTTHAARLASNQGICIHDQRPPVVLVLCKESRAAALGASLLVTIRPAFCLAPIVFNPALDLLYFASYGVLKSCAQYGTRDWKRLGIRNVALDPTLTRSCALIRARFPSLPFPAVRQLAGAAHSSVDVQARELGGICRLFGTGLRNVVLTAGNLESARVFYRPFVASLEKWLAELELLREHAEEMGVDMGPAMELPTVSLFHLPEATFDAAAAAKAEA